MRIFPPRTEPGPQQGFTLIEVLIGLVILAISSAVLARVLQGSLLIRQHQRQEVQTLREESSARSLQFSGEREEPLVTLTPVEPDA